MRKLLLLVGGSLVIWLVLALPVHWGWGGNTLLFSATATGLCLVPMAGTLFWSLWAKGQTGEKMLVAVLGGSWLRMMLVMGGAFALNQTVAVFQPPSFLIWVVVLYLATLTLEVVVLVGGL